MRCGLCGIAALEPVDEHGSRRCSNCGAGNIVARPRKIPVLGEDDLHRYRQEVEAERAEDMAVLRTTRRSSATPPRSRAVGKPSRDKGKRARAEFEKLIVAANISDYLREQDGRTQGADFRIGNYCVDVKRRETDRDPPVVARGGSQNPGLGADPVYRLPTQPRAVAGLNAGDRLPPGGRLHGRTAE